MECKVYGQLVDDNEKPIFDIQLKVILDNSSFFADAPTISVAVTDKNGKFEIDLTLNLEQKEKSENKIKIVFLIDEKPVMNISKEIEDVVDIVFATRFPEKYGLGKFKNMISYGGSPRASINLALASKAFAFIKRRGYVIPEDVRSVCYDVLRHRIGLTYEAEAENITTEDIITEILNAVEVP